MQAFDVALGFLPEPEGKMILLKKLLASNTCRLHNGMIWKPSPPGLSKGAAQTSTVLHRRKAYKPQQQPASKISPRVQWWHLYLGNNQQLFI